MADFTLDIGGDTVTSDGEAPFSVEVTGRRLETSISSTTSVILLLVLAPASTPAAGTVVRLIPNEAAIADEAGNLLIASPTTLGNLDSAISGLPTIAASPPPSPPAVSFAPSTASPPPGVADDTLDGITQALDNTGGVMGFVAVIMGFVFVCCCGLLFLLCKVYRRNKRLRQAKKHEENVEQLEELLSARVDEPGGKEAGARMLHTLQDILMRAKEGISLNEATEEVVHQGSILPPKLSKALSREWRRRHNNDPDADPPTDAEKLDLLRELMRGPPKPPPPLSVLKQAHEEFERAFLRPATSEYEALNHLKLALDAATPGLAKLVEEGLVDAIEEQGGLNGGANGGGGVRLRPPHLKPARGDDFYVAPPPPPPPPPGLEVGALPLAVLEASTALFSNATAPLMSDGHGDGLVEQLGSLKQRLDGIIDAGHLEQAGEKDDNEASDAHVQSADLLPPAVIEAANALFVSRRGRLPSDDLKRSHCYVALFMRRESSPAHASLDGKRW